MTEPKQPRVFVPQHPSVHNAADKINVHDGDLSGVYAFGHPIFMLQPGRLKVSRINRTRKFLEQALFDFSPADFILLVGDPANIALSLLIAGQKTGGHVNVIRWYRQTGEFKVLPL
jgi:hypothetical protein